MSHEDDKLLESVVNLTKIHDKRSLEKALIEILSDFIDFDALILLRIPCSTNNEYVELAASIPKDIVQEKLKLIPHEYGDEHIEQDESIAQCIEEGEIISDKQSSSRRMLFPIIVNNTVVNILDIYGHRSNSSTKKFILNFIRIYSNYLAILVDSERDTLTGLLNRKTFDVQFAEYISASIEEKITDPSIEEKRRIDKNNTYYWIGVLDIDHFKNINDKFGHVYGDEVLLLFSNIMKKTFRNGDLLFRYGGEEFVVVLQKATKLDALKVYERFRKNVELFSFPQVERVTVSIGIVSIKAQKHPTAVLECADKALYYAKEHGRNQVCSYYELIKMGALEVQQAESDIDLF